MRKGNFGMAAGCEQNVLGGEQILSLKAQQLEF
jgi:hypothetical protein